jgi:hypothetical protein
VKKMASTLARKAWYELRDFAGSEGKGIQGFSLVIERVDMQRQEQWHGVFGCEGRKLNLIATLERN